MNNTNFYDYLIECKGFSERSAKDVISRCNRVKKMVSSEEIEEETMDKLLIGVQYENCSMYVKSQLKRSVMLYLEYLRSGGDKSINGK